VRTLIQCATEIGEHVASSGASLTRRGDINNYIDTYFLNQRFNWVVRQSGQFPFNLWRHEQQVVDTKSDEILARYVDFSSSQLMRNADWSGWKLWLNVEHCKNGRDFEAKMGNFVLQAKSLSGVK
jgi:hypothetical protein